MKKKQTIHFYEVYIKLETQEIPILRTTKLSAAKKHTSAHGMPASASMAMSSLSLLRTNLCAAVTAATS